uniref:Ovule protein n=1 Tax=Ascaris lumbricoides TaxID=6252 RepID=A0A0M3ING6_ASCLU
MQENRKRVLPYYHLRSFSPQGNSLIFFHDPFIGTRDPIANSRQIVAFTAPPPPSAKRKEAREPTRPPPFVSARVSLYSCSYSNVK